MIPRPGLWLVLIGLVVGGQSTLAQAAPIGSAVRVVNQVTAEAEQATRPLATGDGVNQNEVIAAAAQSLGELRLNDETKLALGPGAKLKLDKFVYDPAKSTGTVAVDLSIGAFRFITGLARKSSYQIRGPNNASISVRGTIFDVYVAPDGTMWVLLHEGVIEVCNAARQCRTIEDPCGIVRIGPGGELTEPTTWNRQPAVREIDFETAFPFVVRPPQIDAAPRFTRVNVEAGQCVAEKIRPPTERAEGPPPKAPAQAPQVEPPAEESYTGPAAVAAAAIIPRGWTGYYVGVSFGGAWMPGDTPTACDDPFGIVDTVVPDCLLSLATGGLESRYDLDPRGWLADLHGGYNVQTGDMVAGWEIDISGGSVEGSDSAAANLFNGSPGTRHVRQDMEWFGTVRGRLGFVTGDVLLYGTAGLAYGRSRYRYLAEYPTDDAVAFDSKTAWNIGWTAGAGAEWDLGKWSVKGEYLYFDLRDEELSAQLVFAGVPNPVFFRPEFDNNGHIFRFGLSYQLD